ncbi:AraC-like DNA-binding protein/cellobiose-specific phosphotransferase system component IIB [Gracilibacillus halotolerans]|uniref:AraC-like DNA-binding protein/cellobiose-specific phosphotransferase system component IIB n=1 Tax=Gracilibacillus halotolerans TaxID=74386 RepID=A0A841RPX1_9BACI|nr:AraC family transcriptional regulator [Gracilibacillus halotolerans]MBB6512698.1 AraC-like DNA-binding protein/cellobiose-specific phosphotransferase system component IIB [Gracilibacillus halotolerans]
MKSLDIFNNLSEQVMIRINSCSEVKHPNSWLERRQYKDYDVWCIQEGQVQITVQEETFLASEGDVVLFSPDVAYTATTTSKYCRFIFIHFDFSLGNHSRILDNFKLSGILKGAIIKNEKRLFLEAYEKYKRSEAMSQLHLKGSLTILIAKILELYGDNYYHGEFIPVTTTPKLANYNYLDKILPVFDYVENHLHQSISIRELAEIAGMSEKYFITYFKQSLGVTPGNYITQLKMNRARDLLYSKLYSIQEIASMLGYPDPYSFSKAFKKYYQVPPSKFVW